MKFRFFLTLVALNLISLSAGSSVTSGDGETLRTPFSVNTYLIVSIIVSLVFAFLRNRLSELYSNSTTIYLLIVSFFVLVISPAAIYLKLVIVQPMSWVLSMVMLVMVYIGEFFTIGLVYIPLMLLFGLIIDCIRKMMVRFK